MPPKLVKSFAKRSGKSKARVEKLWKKAKKIAAKAGRSRDFKYITGILKRMLKLGEAMQEIMKDLKVMNEKRPILKKAELALFMDATIRMRARWRASEMRDEAGAGALVDSDVPFDDERVAAVGQRVHDDIVTDFSYNENLLKASRSVKNFSAAYVVSVIRKAIKSKQIVAEHAVLAKSFTEAYDAAGLKGKKLRRRKKAK